MPFSYSIILKLYSHILNFSSCICFIIYIIFFFFFKIYEDIEGESRLFFLTMILQWVFLRLSNNLSRTVVYWALVLESGEGYGNPLQCSCLENPRDSAAWWAALYGVTRSRTRLKRLSSSSSSVRITCWVW